MRLSIALLTILATVFPSTESTACCLSNWLYGRPSTVYAAGYAPYTVGYAPVATSTYAAGYAPVAASPVATATYAAGYAPVATSPVPTATYAAGYAPVTSSTIAPAYAAAPSTTSVLQPASGTAPVVNSGAYHAQRPAYYNNPSVYTGMPVTGNQQTSYRVPIASTLRGASPRLPTIGDGSSYPTYRAGYGSVAAPGMPITTGTPTGAPVTAIPATQVAPIYPTTPQYAATPQQHAGGLSRFFGSLYGTNYRTSYYRAPVTYYRPVTSVDPVSGTTVTVQRPCTSTVQQVQRTPYNSLQFGQHAAAQPAAACQTTPVVGGCNTYSQATPYAPSPYAVVPSTGVQQAGAIGSGSQFTTPIPSTPTYYGQGGYSPNTAPLTGAPLSGSPLSGTPGPAAPTIAPPSSLPSTSPSAGSPRDMAPVDQPSLQEYSPTESSYREEATSEPAESPRPAPKSFWELQDADDSTAMIRETSESPFKKPRDPVSLSVPEFTGATPIQAPEDYVSPFRKQSVETPAAAVNSDELEAPPLPAQTWGPSDMTSVSTRNPVRVREAAMTRGRVAKPVQRKRVSTWHTVKP